MRKYETIIVIDPTLSEADLKEELQKLQGIIEARGATNVSIEVWGKKEIAYLVQRHRFGYYVCFKYDLDNPTAVEDLTNLLRITERVIKFQTHRIQETSRKFKGNPKKLLRGESDDALAAESEF